MLIFWLVTTKSVGKTRERWGPTFESGLARNLRVRVTSSAVRDRFTLCAFSPLSSFASPLEGLLPLPSLIAPVSFLHFSVDFVDFSMIID